MSPFGSDSLSLDLQLIGNRCVESREHTWKLAYGPFVGRTNDPYPQ